MPGTKRSLSELQRLRLRFEDGRGEEKRARIAALAAADLGPGQLLELHELLCFMRAYPDDPALLAEVEAQLAGFAGRADLARHRARLQGTGVAGTLIAERLFWPLARWIAGRWPAALELGPLDEEARGRLAAALPALVPAPEAELLRRTEDGPEAWLDRLRGCAAGGKASQDLAESAGPPPSRATFLLERLSRMPGDDRTREALHDGLDLPYRLSPGADTPSRTAAFCPVGQVAFRAGQELHPRPTLRAALAQPPRQIRRLPPEEGARFIERAREAMVTRQRDLEVFGFGNPADVHLLLDEDGLSFAAIGFEPERRLPLPAAYGLLNLMNGVPVGYSQADVLFGHAEVSFNTFPTFRGAEAGWVFGRLLAALRAFLGAESFSVEPYQLGHHNAEGIDSGAFWFYAKFGFEPRDRRARQLFLRERERLAERPGRRSSRATLAALAERHVHRGDGFADWSALVRKAQERLARLYGAERERGLVTELGLLARRLEVPPPPAAASPAELSPEARAAARLAPVLLLLPELESWGRGERAALWGWAHAKGAPSELPYLEQGRAHPRLEVALRSTLAAL